MLDIDNIITLNNLSNKKIILILCIAYFIIIICDINTRYKDCLTNKKYEIIPVMLFHNIITVLLYLGCLFNNKVVIMIHISK